MKCLTICQPWAWCIVHGPKRYENRSWRYDHRGPLLIHVGRSRRRMTPEVFAQLARLGLEPPDPDCLVFGAIVGVCRVVDCVPVEQAYGDAWAVGPWCIKLANVHALVDPIPCRGQRRVFDVELTPGQLTLVENALGGGDDA